MTVLLVLAFFVALITMDYMVTRRRMARESQALAAAAIPAVEPAWVAGYQMPETLYYHRGHTWARPLDAHTVVIGVDDFARRLIGPAATVKAPSRGDWVHQGGRALRPEARRQDGRARLARRGRGDRGQPRAGREARSRRRGPLRPRLGAEGEGPQPRRTTSATSSRAVSPASGWRTAARPSSCGSWPSPARCCRTAASPPPTWATTSRRRTGTGSSTSSCSPRPPGPTLRRRTTMALMPNPKSRAVLFDVTRCVGCHECAKACKAAHEFPGTGEETELDAIDLHRGARQGRRPLPAPHVHALRRPELRERLPGRRVHQDRARPRRLRRLEVPGLPLLHDRLPLQRASLRVVEGGAGRPQVRRLHREAEGRQGQRLRRGLPRRGDGRRHPRGAAGRGEEADRGEPRHLPPRGLRRARGGRDERPRPLPRPVRAAGNEDGPRHPAAAEPHLGRAVEDPQGRRGRLRGPLAPSTGSPTGAKEVAAAERGEKE